VVDIAPSTKGSRRRPRVDKIGRVTIVRRGEGGRLSIRWWDRTIDDWRWKSTKTSNLTEARKVAAAKDDELRRERGLPSPSRLTAIQPQVPTLWRAMREAIDSSNANDRTHAQYETYAVAFKTWVRKHHPEVRLFTDLSLALVQDYIHDLKALGRSYDNIRNRVVPIRMCALHMTSYAYLNPLARLRVRRRTPVEIRFWEPVQMLVFLRWAKIHQPQLYPCYLLQTLCGVRGYEGLFVRREDISLSQGTVRITSTPHHEIKNHCSPRVIPVGETVIRELRDWIGANDCHPVHGYLCLDARGEPWSEKERRYGPTKRFETYMRRHAPKNTPRISWKDLRSSFSTLCETELGVNDTALTFYMGHSGKGIRHRHYTTRRIEALRREVAEKVEAWVSLRGF
jgi:integrase